MAADIVPIRLGLTKGDLYTLWAPRWRDSGDEWEALLGKDEDLYAFESVADLAAFIRTNSDNDLTDHPAWEELTEANAHRFDPAEERQYDLIGVQELVAEKPSRGHRWRRCTGRWPSCRPSARCANCPRSPSSSTATPSSARWARASTRFSGRSGRKRWGEIEAVDRAKLGQRRRRDRRGRHHPRRRRGGVGEGGGRARGTQARTRGDRGVAETEADDVDASESDSRGRPRSPTTLVAAPHGRPGARRRRGLLAQGRHRPGADDDPRRHVLHAALLPRRLSRCSSAATAGSACSAPSVRWRGIWPTSTTTTSPTWRPTTTSARRPTTARCGSTSPTRTST